MLKIGKKILNGDQCKLCFFGDSLTEGCFEFNEDFSDTTFRRENGYPYKLKEKIKKELGKDIEVINAGKSGNTVVKALKRFESDVLDKHPDFCLIMLGANDVVNIDWGNMTQETYLETMRYFFNTLKEHNIETVFMTPSMVATKDKGTLKHTKFQEVLDSCVKLQNDGTIDSFFEDAKSLCNELNVPVIDVYKIWKKMEKDGVDITDCLCNDVNHPYEEYHHIFADEIYKKMFNED